jgi:hypothetical protein
MTQRHFIRENDILGDEPERPRGGIVFDVFESAPQTLQQANHPRAGVTAATLRKNVRE